MEQSTSHTPEVSTLTTVHISDSPAASYDADLRLDVRDGAAKSEVRLRNSTNPSTVAHAVCAAGGAQARCDNVEHGVAFAADGGDAFSDGPAIASSQYGNATACGLRGVASVWKKGTAMAGKGGIAHSKKPDACSIVGPSGIAIARVNTGWVESANTAGAESSGIAQAGKGGVLIFQVFEGLEPGVEYSLAVFLVDGREAIADTPYRYLKGKLQRAEVQATIATGNEAT